MRRILHKSRPALGHLSSPLRCALAARGRGGREATVSAAYQHERRWLAPIANRVPSRPPDTSGHGSPGWGPSDARGPNCARLFDAIRPAVLGGLFSVDVGALD